MPSQILLHVYIAVCQILNTALDKAFLSCVSNLQLSKDGDPQVDKFIGPIECSFFTMYYIVTVHISVCVLCYTIYIPFQYFKVQVIIMSISDANKESTLRDISVIAIIICIM